MTTTTAMLSVEVVSLANPSHLEGFGTIVGLRERRTAVCRRSGLSLVVGTIVGGIGNSTLPNGSRRTAQLSRGRRIARQGQPPPVTLVVEVVAGVRTRTRLTNADDYVMGRRMIYSFCAFFVCLDVIIVE